jgi:hypothetical protein
MRFRKLRIAWSVMSGIAAVLLIVLWVRSYYNGDSVECWHNLTRVTVSSICGQFVAVSVDYSAAEPAVFKGLKFHTWNATNSPPIMYVENSLRMPSLLGFRFGRVLATAQRHPFVLIGVPYWFSAFAAAVLAASPRVVQG